MTISLRSALIAIMVLAAGSPPASANVVILVDKATQRMSVSVDGAPRYQFAVSTGRPGYGTPSGTFHPQRMERTWFSREYYNSPMPHAIFFHGGFAIHGSYEINRLGGPASHGCIRLHPSNAATLFALVEREGTGATTIVVSGGDHAAMRDAAPAARAYGRPHESDYDAPYIGYGRQYFRGYRGPEALDPFPPFPPY